LKIYLATDVHGLNTDKTFIRVLSVSISGSLKLQYIIDSNRSTPERPFSLYPRFGNSDKD